MVISRLKSVLFSKQGGKEVYKFAQLLDGLTEYQALLTALKEEKTPALVTGLSQIHKAQFGYSIAQTCNKSIIIITPDEPTALKLCEDINYISCDEIALYYPSRDFTFRDVQGVSLEYEHARLSVLLKCVSGKAPIIVASVEAATQLTISPSYLKEKTKIVQIGDSLNVEEMRTHLTSIGYERCEQVDGVCKFSIRGGIVDFFPPDSTDPYRIELWGDEIDTISSFKVDTQRRELTLDCAMISPAREVVVKSVADFNETLNTLANSLSGKYGAIAKQQIAKDIETLNTGLSILSIDRYLPLLYREKTTLLDYIDNGILMVSELNSCKETLKNQSFQMQEDVNIMLEEGLVFKDYAEFGIDYTELTRKMISYPTVLLDTFARTNQDIPLKSMVNVNALSLSCWSGEMEFLKEDIESYQSKNYCILIFAGTKRGADALLDDLERYGIKADFVPNVTQLIPKKIFVCEGGLSAGYEYPDLKLVALTHAKTHSIKPKPRKKTPKGQQIRSLSDINIGDYIVHNAHGIGVFEGIVKREIMGIVKDYIKIRYAGTDALFVPVTQLDLVSKYIGTREDGSVKLSKLNSLEWQKTRQRVKKAVEEMAKELIELYAKRAKLTGFSFSEDNDWQMEFERKFEFEETDDQLRCIEEIKADMEKPHPMDRLLCGDVGFGKTEVAIRAAFKCVMDSKQCAVLVPTTILAWQHFQTFKKRMDGYPIRIELLSRFRTPKQQEEIIREVRMGKVDIVIGTHRIVQKDMIFKDLGLCIIDEEQRFGVAHKEKFKEMRNDVDVLTLSATPIPRTLNMAMSGIRDMSVIEEAPMDRRPVQTYVLEHDFGIVSGAIEKELRRGGQVFYLHNRVSSIDSCAKKIMEFLPDAVVATAHGKMGEEELSNIWRKLVSNEIQVLVCTTIIETGVDISNCNTLIIEDADRMGLSQLYQLRGRVGRSTRRAFAYLTFKRDKALSDIATKRLSAIREFTSFGSGFRIAMRDLEIRGAGNVLGTSQHGHMEAVGYDMYLKLLGEAISEQKGEVVKKSAECMIDIRIPAHIPEAYISELSQRIDIYKKIAFVSDNEQGMDMIDELIDRFGEPPKSVLGLIEVAKLRNMAANLGFKEIAERGESVLFYPQELDILLVGILAKELSKNNILLNAGVKPFISAKLCKGQNATDLIRDVILTLAKG